MLIGCPTPPQINIAVVENLIAIILKAKKLTDVEVGFGYKTGVRTDRNRNEILKMGLEVGYTHFLWLDTDMLFPLNIIEKYLEADKDIIGCMYYKRGVPFAPVGYYKSKKTPFKYNHLNPQDLPVDSVIEVDGLGFGGMMVKREAYEKMGDDKWGHYGENYHLPMDVGNHLTHDLEFCRLAQEHGVHIHLHTGVKPGHLTEFVVNEEFYLGYKEVK